MRISDVEINDWFTYHAPSAEQLPKYEELREKGRILAVAIRDLCPPSADATAAIRKVREAVMTANQGIACGGGDW